MYYIKNGYDQALLWDNEHSEPTFGLFQSLEFMKLEDRLEPTAKYYPLMSFSTPFEAQAVQLHLQHYWGYPFSGKDLFIVELLTGKLVVGL